MSCSGENILDNSQTGQSIIGTSDMEDGGSLYLTKNNFT